MQLFSLWSKSIIFYQGSNPYCNPRKISFSQPLYNAKDADRRPFCVGWGTNASKRCYATRSVVELGSHFASKAMGARSREPRAKIFTRSVNTLVPAKRRGIRFAFAARRSTSSLVRHRACESRSEAELPQCLSITDSRGRLSLQKILYIFRKIWYNIINK